MLTEGRAMSKICDFLFWAAVVTLGLTALAVANDPAPGEVHVSPQTWALIGALLLFLLREVISAWRQRATDDTRRSERKDKELQTGMGAKVDTAHCTEVRDMCVKGNDRRHEEGRLAMEAFRAENRAGHATIHTEINHIGQQLAANTRAVEMLANPEVRELLQK